ncbi:hypothetical protein [Corynebacterium striatum]|uniref:hypothetical protein n=1 Tax=Corynebacterium striatum TaxID=43770 RepID=UPI0012FAC135|nr:hypothetical protein [Corynebacterium striatum]MCG7248769.1 hypothetical protein [Corynebacterium striatum]HAT1180295.1 hypothetical protein [Corynebacterium striatum]HAT6616372.1 hypothetical protein [Corynebacterium striatum]HBC7266053.1 hypothetical protein [Corynebacterium striatum]HBC8576287.1 hypothetical protein [Corynebacterium striatum]
MERDFDELQEVWGETVPLIKTQVMVPWSLAAAVELANGHRGSRRAVEAALSRGDTSAAG